MSGVDRDVVTRRLAAMRMLLDHLESLHIVDEHDLTELGIRLQVERALTQIVNLAAEVNAHVAVVRLHRPPEDYRQGFDRMVEAGWLERSTAESLKPSVGLRNVLTHEYTDINLAMVAAAVPLALTGYRGYLREVAQALKSSGTSGDR